jgi:hypothetical protein
MANVKLIFYGTDNTSDHELTAYLNNDNEIYMHIDCGAMPPTWITLDKSTAIKFAKTLRTEINKIEEVEDGNF